MTEQSGTGVSILDQDECWSLARAAQIGRIAVTFHGAPEIFPINFAIDHGCVVFRTAPGTKLAAITDDSAAAFEVDGYEPAAGLAWSVIVKGRATQVKATYELLETIQLPLFPLHGGPKGSIVRLVAEQVSGRRFHVVAPETWNGPIPNVRRASPE